MNELVAQQSVELASNIGYTDEVSWTPPADMDFDTFQKIGNTFQQIRESLSFWYGDWLLSGEERFGENAYQAIPEIGRSSETILKYKAVCARVPKNIRRSDCSWTMHFYVAYTLVEHRGPLLDLAANVGLSSRELKEVVRLSDDRRQAILEAYENYCEEEGMMTYETFMRLLNQYKMEAIEDKAKGNNDDEEDDDDTESDDEEETVARPVDADDITDWWEQRDVPLISLGANHAVWEGLTCYAAMNGDGKAVIIWEKTND